MRMLANECAQGVPTGADTTSTELAQHGLWGVNDNRGPIDVVDPKEENQHRMHASEAVVMTGGNQLELWAVIEALDGNGKPVSGQHYAPSMSPMEVKAAKFRVEAAAAKAGRQVCRMVVYPTIAAYDCQSRFMHQSYARPQL